MSKPDWESPINPYESPKPTESQQDSFSGGPWTMDYFGGFRVIQSNPNWLTNCLLVGVVGMFIPIVGAIALLGYSYETAELLHRTNGKIYWDFNFNRFSDYLIRGVGPFLIFFAFAVLLGIAGLFIQTAVGIHFNVPLGPFQDKPFRQEDIPLYIVAYLVSTLIQNVLQTLLAFIYYPMGIRGGLAKEFSQSFDIARGLDLLARTWAEMLLMFLIYGVLTFGMLLLGTATCCLGFIPLTGYLATLNGWWTYQLYRKYLSRGGEPIPLKPLPGQQQ